MFDTSSASADISAGGQLEAEPEIGGDVVGVELQRPFEVFARFDQTGAGERRR